jgi:hypothetical protein
MNSETHRTSLVGKRAIHTISQSLGNIIEVTPQQGYEDVERLNNIFLDNGNAGHRHYFLIEGDDLRFWGQDYFKQYVKKFETAC